MVRRWKKWEIRGKMWKSWKSDAKCGNHGNGGKSKFSPTGADPRRMSCQGTGRRRWEIFSMFFCQLWIMLSISVSSCFHILPPVTSVWITPSEAAMENSTLPTFGMQQCIQIVHTCAYRAESMQEHIVSHWSIAEKGRKMRQKSACTMMMMMMIVIISFVGLVGTGRWMSAREGESCTSVWSWLL